MSVATRSGRIASAAASIITASHNSGPDQAEPG
jgi:hypothetical protein